MILPSAPRGEPIQTYNFFVYIGLVKIPFTRVSSIEMSVETETLVEGGVNSHVLTMRKPTTTEKTLVLEKGSGSSNMIWNMVFSQTLAVGERIAHIIIGVTDANQSMRKAYLVSGLFVKKLTLSDLDAVNGNVLIERFEMSYEKMREIPGASLLPFSV